MKRLLPMQSLLTLGTGNELKGLESCEEKLGGAVVGTMDGTFWVPCIITGWADGGGTMVKHGVKPCVDAFPDGFFWVVHGGHFPTEESIEMGDPKRRFLGINFLEQAAGWNSMPLWRRLVIPFPSCYRLCGHR